ncbi:MAG: tyrosine-type recombinase/integrase [Nitrososphaerales archaeon]
MSEEKLKEAEEKIKKALRPPIEKVMQEWALRPLVPRSILDVAGLSEDEVIDVSDLNDFRAWLKDQNKSPVTQREYPRLLRRSFKHINKPITLSKIKEYLRRAKERYSPDHYSLTLTAFKNYMKFKGCSNALDEFKHIHKGFTPKMLPSKEDLQRFYNAIPSLIIKAYFMLLATSGLRPGEIKSLTLDDVDFNQRLLRPSCHKGATKHSWVSFYNEEAEKVLKQFRESLSKKQEESKKLLPISSRDLKRDWKEAQIKSGIKLKPKDLRDWFCSEMAELGVSDRYVDAFCGRMPRSILARHYSDYNPKRLKRIYDQAGLKVLS